MCTDSAGLSKGVEVIVDIDHLVDSGMRFFRDQTLWAVLIAVLIGGFIYWKPKAVFKLAMAALVLGAIIYVVMFLVNLTSQGISETQKFTTTPSDETK